LGAVGAGAVGATALTVFGACAGSGGPRRTILVDGSSTVAPISQAVAEEFQAQARGVRVPVGVSGTGGGFKKFCSGEIDIVDASRPIKPSEVSACADNGVEYIELPVAFDGLAVLTNFENDFVDCLTVAELKTIWEPAAEERVTSWAQVRDGFPDLPLVLYGPGVDSGTYDYFTNAIVGAEGASRGDFTPSENDNVLVQGIAGDAGALGFFGLAYYTANAESLKLLKVDGDGGCVAPSDQTVNDGSYQPLSRPIFIYVNRAAAERPEIQAFVRFYLENAAFLVGDVGYVRLPDALYEAALGRFDERVVGSVFDGGSQTGLSLTDMFKN
jgi:phosphate transport system substrate-binding protein